MLRRHLSDSGPHRSCHRLDPPDRTFPDRGKGRVRGDPVDPEQDVRLPCLRDSVLARLGIGPKLALAFSALAAITVIVVVLALLAGKTVTRDIDLAEGERLPGSITSERAQASLLRMQLHVRGYLVLGNKQDIEGYQEQKLLFEHDLSRLRELARNWPPEDAYLVSELVADYEQWVPLPQKLFELHDDPLTNRPASRLVRFEVQPRREDVLRRLEAMIASQKALGASTADTGLLADLVGFQTSFDAMVTDLMAFAVSGDPNFQSAYDRHLAATAALWQRLSTRRDVLDDAQRKNLSLIQQRRTELGEVARQIINVMSGDRSFEDLYLYRTQAEPLAQSMLRVFGTLTARQQARMQGDLGRARERLWRAGLPATVGGLLAIALAVLLAYISQRRIARPIQHLAEVAEQVATGTATASTEALASDEITRLSQTLNTRLRKEELQHLMASISDAVWSAVLFGDGSLVYRYLSPVIERIAGRPPEHFLGSAQHWLDGVHPADRTAVAEGLARIASGTSDREDTEYRIIRPDGEVRWVRDSVRATSLEGGQFLLNGVVSDITERKAAQDELLTMERQLRHAQRLEAIGTLAGGIAHDFNNILGAILGYSELAIRQAPRGSRLRRDLDSVVAAGERGRALVDRVLTFSRSGSGERLPVHVEEVVSETLDLIAAKVKTGITIERDFAAGRAAILGDPTQIHQVLMNLATNALQAMPDGGSLRVSLSIVTNDTARAATTAVLEAGEFIALAVTDTGIGMTKDLVERIFDPFFTTKEVGVGTGLGLSLVHGIVTDLDGAIEVKTMPGQGSTFTVYLPRAGDAPSKLEHRESGLARGDSQSVLVVDDEEPLARLTTERLAALGYAPITFTSSVAALEAFRAHPDRFHAVVTDERMPGLSGSALVRQIRETHADVPIILMSGFVNPDLVARTQDLGVDEVLKKPVGERDLAAALARVLGAGVNGSSAALASEEAAPPGRGDQRRSE